MALRDEGRRPKKPRELPATPKASWAKIGWRDLRWGMGPRDVAERLAPDVMSELDMSGDEPNQRHFNAPLRDALYGKRVDAVLGFIDGRLFEVSIRQPDRAGRPENDWPWVKRIRAGLEAKYGKPATDGKNSGGWNESTWNVSPALEITLLWASSDDFFTMSLSYRHPATSDEEAAKL